MRLAPCRGSTKVTESFASDECDEEIRCGFERATIGFCNFYNNKSYEVLPADPAYEDPCGDFKCDGMMDGPCHCDPCDECDAWKVDGTKEAEAINDRLKSGGQLYNTIRTKEMSPGSFRQTCDGDRFAENYYTSDDCDDGKQTTKYTDVNSCYRPEPEDEKTQ